MPDLKLQIEFDMVNVELIETTSKLMADSIGRMESTTLISGRGGPSKARVNHFLLVWTEKGEGWNHKIAPVSFEKNHKVIKIQDTEGDQWVFALQE